MSVAHLAPLNDSRANARRSQGSLAFEKLWRAIPREGLVPRRAAFNPASAGEILRKLVLIEAATRARPGLYFRLAGDTLNANFNRNMAGQDWLTFLPREVHADAIETGRLICEHPCGVWQLHPIHHQRGLSQLAESTVFPLGHAADGTPLMLGYVEFFRLPRWTPAPPAAQVTVFAAETAEAFAFIDVGAGTPAWKA